jgi:hypothetical protein
MINFCLSAGPGAFFALAGKLFSYGGLFPVR